MARTQRTIRRALHWAAMALLVGAILRPDFLLAEAAAKSASRPTSQTAASTRPTSLQDELAQVGDYDDVVYDSGFYALKDAIDDFRPEEGKVVTVGELRDSPALFRGRPVRLTLTFFDVTEPDQDSDSRNRCFEIRAYAGDIRRTKPVTIFSRSAPPTMRSGTKFEVLGYFYKVIRRRHEGAARSDETTLLNVPLIVAYQFNPLSVGSEPVGWKFSPVFLWIPAVIGLAIVYIWLRSRYSRRGTAWQRGSRYSDIGPYRPMRYDMTPEEDERIKANLGDLAQLARPGDSAPPDRPADSKTPPNAGK